MKVRVAPGFGRNPCWIESAGCVGSQAPADEMAFVDAAVARIIPNDDLGPGAKEAGVGLFIDRQLAGPYGRGETWYMQGPWREGAPNRATSRGQRRRSSTGSRL